jgi:hypothetical protein
MDLTGADWRKSRYSGSNGGNYVDVATNLPGSVAVRDSTDLHSLGPVFTTDAWDACLRTAADRDPIRVTDGSL